MNRLLFFLAIALVAAACTPASAPPGSAGDSAATSSGTDPSTTVVTEEPGEPAQSFAGTVAAPEFPTGLDWINTAGPIALADLKGKVVLLDFWTYGCINCIHVIPDLKRLEEEYAEELVAIGVHSAKFANEAVTDQIKEVVQRYGIEHPVVNDKDFVIWSNWRASAWPTIALIDPAGNLVGTRAGEGVYDAIEPVIASLVDEFDAAGAINRDRIEFVLEADQSPDRPLSYPGKVLAASGRLWVSDTGHNRVLEVDPDTGDVLAAYGSGEQGAADGASLEASFNSPQGLALHDDTLLIADTNNHLIRAVNLSTGEVSTAAGTGELGYPARAGFADEVALNSPWALLADETTLYVANAGSHQLVAIDLQFGTIEPLVGSARESTANGSFLTAELAQPSGLALSDDGILYFADSESSSIRAADLTSEQTSLVVGGDATLFEFGDQDGTGNTARLQHPLGAALNGDLLYIADTYNSKIKRVDVGTNSVTSWLGSVPGWADGSDPQFNEPGGLSFDDGRLFVADTNNHSIRIVDIDSGETSTLILKGVEEFDPPASFSGDVITLDAVSVHAGPASLALNYTLPDGYKVNDDAPSSLEIAGERSIASIAGSQTADLTGTELPVSLPLELTEGSSTVLIDVTLIYCEAVASSLCFIDRARFEIPLDVGPPGPSSQISLRRTIPDPNG